MNVFSNVTNQVSGLGSSLGSWFKKEGKENGEGSAAAPTPADSQPEETSAPPPEKSTKSAGEENEDAASQHSGATEGADSHPASENEEEEGKAGFASGLAFNLSGVSSRASAGAKSVGSFFSSAFSKAGDSVKAASSRIKETVEKNPLLSEFNKEQEAFIAAKGGKTGQALPPWIGYPQEEKLREEIMSLSTDRRHFVRSPPQEVNFEFDLEQFLPVAEATLKADENLEKMRFELVPKVVNEENFWRNYFYRVGLIRQSTELSSLEKDQPNTDSENANKTEATKGLKNKDEDIEQVPGTASVGTAGADTEFVSDSFQPSSKDVEEIRKGVQSLTKSSGEPDWEAELCEELGEDLGEYEVVESSKDDDKWEEELQNMMDDEETADLR